MIKVHFKEQILSVDRLKIDFELFQYWTELQCLKLG